MNVLIISLEYSPDISGGIGTHVEELSAGLARHGHRVSVLACTLGKEEVICEASRNIYLVPPNDNSVAHHGRSITQGILAVNAALAAYANKIVIRERGIPDVIQCYNWLTFEAAHDLRKSYGVPVVSSVHFISEPVERFWGQIPNKEIVEQEQRAVQKADKLIAVSRSLKDLLQSTYDISDDKVRVVYNGLDMRAFEHTGVSAAVLESLKNLLVPQGGKIVLFVGRLNPHKGIQAILSSIPSVVEEYPKTRYVFAGDPDSPQFARLIDETVAGNAVLKRCIVRLGKLPRKKIAALYQIADVMLIPSVYDFCPYAALEAMAARVPLVASGVGGLAEIISHEENGLLIPVHAVDGGTHAVDVSALTRATKRILGNTDFGKQLAAAANWKARQAFDLRTMTTLTEEVLKSLLVRA